MHHQQRENSYFECLMRKLYDEDSPPSSSNPPPTSSTPSPSLALHSPSLALHSPCSSCWATSLPGPILMPVHYLQPLPRHGLVSRDSSPSLAHPTSLPEPNTSIISYAFRFSSKGSQLKANSYLLSQGCSSVNIPDITVDGVTLAAAYLPVVPFTMRCSLLFTCKGDLQQPFYTLGTSHRLHRPYCSTPETDQVYE